MPPMSAEAVTAAVADPVQAMGGAFMLDRATLAYGREQGFPKGLSFYVAGRGGVLGDAEADVVTAAFGFFAPAVIERFWDEGRRVMPPRQAASHFAEAARRWGRERLADFDGAGRLAELAERVVAAVDPAGLVLFAGWRAQPLPDDAPGRASQLVHVLREHRGSAHLVAVRATGLSVPEAIVARDGTGRAQTFGWTGDLPEPEPLQARRAEAEALTGRLVAPAFAVLDEAERGELAELIDIAHRHAIPG